MEDTGDGWAADTRTAHPLRLATTAVGAFEGVGDLTKTCEFAVFTHHAGGAPRSRRNGGSE
jgi:hypothetical protein